MKPHGIATSVHVYGKKKKKKYTLLYFPIILPTLNNGQIKIKKVMKDVSVCCN